MNARAPMPRRKAPAPFATLCVALLALLCSLFLTVEGPAVLLWAGLDAVYADEAASCVGAASPAERCGEEFAARPGGSAAG